MKQYLFIDPASISSGWAHFDEKGPLSSGTIKAPQKLNVFERLRKIYADYQQLAGLLAFDEVHIEQLVRNTHVFTHWSVAIIGTALLSASKQVTKVAGDAPIRAWQKAVGWSKDKKKKVVIAATSPLKRFVGHTSSEDELAAIGIGFYWIRRPERKL